MNDQEQPSVRARRGRWAYEAALTAMTQLHAAAVHLPRDHPAHQELDEARLAVKVALDAMRP